MSSLNNSNLNSLASLFFFLVVLYSCTPTVTKTARTTNYEEDLSVHRPDYPAPSYNTPLTKQAPIVIKPEIEPTGHIKSELDSVLHAMILSKKDVRYINGYSIQVYSGNVRDQAAEVRKKVKEISEDFEPKISYSQPNYKVKVGKYFSRIEANRDLVTLKEEFGQALLVPDKIRIE